MPSWTSKILAQRPAHSIPVPCRSPPPTPAPGHEPRRAGRKVHRIPERPAVQRRGARSVSPALGGRAPEKPARRAPRGPSSRLLRSAKLELTCLLRSHPSPPSPTQPGTPGEPPQASHLLTSWDYCSTHLANLEGSSGLHQEGNQLNGRRVQARMRSPGPSPCG